MLRMVSYPHRPQSGHITCYLNRTYHVLSTCEALHACILFLTSVGFFDTKSEQRQWEAK